MKKISGYWLLLITMVSFLFTFMSADKWDVPMGMVLIFSWLGVYDMLTLLVPLTGYTATAIFLYSLIKNIRTLYHRWSLLAAACLCWICIALVQTKESVQIEWRHGIYLFIPQVIFVFSSLLLAKRVLVK